MKKALSQPGSAAVIDAQLQAAITALRAARAHLLDASWHFEDGINSAERDPSAAYWADFARQGELMAMADELDALSTRVSRLRRRAKSEAADLARERQQGGAQ